MVQHRIGFLVAQPVRMDVRLVVGRRVPAVHSRLVPFGNIALVIITS